MKKIFVLKSLFTFFLLAGIAFFSAQTTTVNSGISGTVVEESSGQPLAGVSITTSPVQKTVTTNSDGRFTIENLPAGQYEVTLTLSGYDTKSVSEIDVPLNDFANINVTLAAAVAKPAVREGEQNIEGVVITRTRARAETVNALLTMQKNSVRVSDGISAETIRRTPDRTTSDVIKRVSGASIQDNKFVIIRGLNDRYNTSYLNGSPLPSSEPDRKAFSFDIFPANMIDNLVIYKTATPDLPGEFAGGVIDITTKSVSDKNFNTLSAGVGFNDKTTGKKQLFAEGVSNTLIGGDNGSRAFPDNFPTVAQFQALQGQRNEASVMQIDALTKASLKNWSLGEKEFSPNWGFSYTMARRGKKNPDFGYIASVTRSQTNNFTTSDRKTYEYEQVGNNYISTLDRDLHDNNYSVQQLFGAIANFSWKADQSNTFTFKNLFSFNSTSNILERTGALNQDSDQLMQNASARLFTSNSIYTGQLGGEHNLRKSKIRINWVGSLSKVVRSTPNDMRNSYVYMKNEDGTVTNPRASIASSNLSVDAPGTFFSSRNDENTLNTKIDVSRRFRFSDDAAMEVKVGGFIQSRDRDFQARLMGYQQFRGTVNGVNYGTNTFDSGIASMDEDHIFTLANMGILGNGKSGLTLADATKGNDFYTASSKLKAGYFMFDNSYKMFRLIWGARYEAYKQLLNSKDDANKPVDVENKENDFLPSANLIVALNKKQNLRFSYSKTLNRPEFRELAPFLFYDAMTTYNTQGTPELKIAKIQNLDLRYEIFPGRGQLFSLSGFYKKFENPIELIAEANNSNKYRNADSGISKGIEIEYRTMISSIVGAKESKFLDDLTFFTNLSVIRSKVDISNIIQSETLEDIPLQGQSPYVFNAGLQYLNADKGWSFAVNMNKIGDRVFAQADQTQGLYSPAIWEKSRTFIDMQLAKSLMKNKIELKLNVQNLLAEDQQFYLNNATENNPNFVTKSGFQGFFNNVFTGDKNNKNGFNEGVDDELWRTRFGRTYSFTVNYNF